MIQDTGMILSRDLRILLPSILPILFLRRTVRRPRFTIAAMDVASASPPCASGCMRITLRRMFTMRASMAIRTGVFVFCNE